MCISYVFYVGAVRYGQEILSAPSGFFTKLVPIVVQNFSDMFPELSARKEYVMSVIAGTIYTTSYYFQSVSQTLLSMFLVSSAISLIW